LEFSIIPLHLKNKVLYRAYKDICFGIQLV